MNEPVRCERCGARVHNPQQHAKYHQYADEASR